jgi:hypothetical protein
MFGNANSCVGGLNDLITIKSTVLVSGGGGGKSWKTSNASPQSKGTNLLLSIKTTTKMKRTHHNQAAKKNVHLQQGMALFASENFAKGGCASCKKTVCACAFTKGGYEAEEYAEGCSLSSSDDLDSPTVFTKFDHVVEKPVKKNSLKSFGVSIANIFKPNVN